MNYLLTCLASCFIFQIVCGQENWAILIASSNQYWNYRHQADICHAYNVLISNNFNPDQIITFAYDDIAHNLLNPLQGQLFNQPNGQDVYRNCVIDYKDDDVNPMNIQRVLRGEGLGKILNSTNQDNVFIYLSDHGSVGFLSFPSNQKLYKDELIDLLYLLNTKQKYKQLVFFLEACESGSMFDDLPENINVYALSASNQTDSSYATYCPPLNDKAQGRHLRTCLGDLFSVNWMKFIEQGQPNMRLEELFAEVKKQTWKSEVMEWGDLNIKKEKISSFLSNSQQSVAAYPFDSLEVQDARDIKLQFLLNQYTYDPSTYQFNQLQQEINERSKFDQQVKIHFFNYIYLQFSLLRTKLNLNIANQHYPYDMGCFKQFVQIYETNCQPFSEYGVKYARYLSLACIQDQNVSNEQFEQIIQQIC